jgi:hypothetical protein
VTHIQADFMMRYETLAIHSRRNGLVVSFLFSPLLLCFFLEPSQEARHTAALEWSMQQPTTPVLWVVNRASDSPDASQLDRPVAFTYRTHVLRPRAAGLVNGPRSILMRATASPMHVLRDLSQARRISFELASACRVETPLLLLHCLSLT